MAADGDTSGILSNVIAGAVMVGGIIMAGFAVVRSLINAGRDAREARALTTRHEEKIVALEKYQGRDEEIKKHILATLERIEGQLAEAINNRGGHRRGQG